VIAGNRKWEYRKVKKSGIGGEKIDIFASSQFPIILSNKREV
jgi:hypothetical protein